MRNSRLLDHVLKPDDRSKKEALRLHRLNRTIRQPVKDDLPDISSHSEDGDEWSSNAWSEGFGGDSSQGSEVECFGEGSDVEMPYEAAPRPRRPSWNEDSENEVQRLPIKLLDGQVKHIGLKQRGNREGFSEESDDEVSPEPTPEPCRDTTLGSRLSGRSVVDVLTTKSRKKRIHVAKEQIASICQEITGDTEDSVRCFHPARITSTHVHPSASAASPSAQFLSRNYRIPDTIATCCKRPENTKARYTFPSGHFQGCHPRLSHSFSHRTRKVREGRTSRCKAS